MIGNCDRLYVAGLFALLVHQFKLYVMVFVLCVAVGEYVCADLTLVHVCGLVGV